MAIFQKSVLNKYLKQLDNNAVELAFAKFKENYSAAKIQKIIGLKEEEYQDGFLRDIFVDVFGYALNPDDNYNLAREFKNIADSKKADGAILKDGKAIAVIELKSTKTKDFAKVTDQAFGYKNNQPGCKYVIISNFRKLRFYIDFAAEYEEFDLFTLAKEEFELLYLILNKDNLFSDLPLKLKEETKFHEEQISDKLYKDYSLFKKRLFDNLVKNNPEQDKLALFKKSQKLLDRFLFILFSEDCGLLPPNSIPRIVDTFKKLEELDAYKPIYDIYKQYFGYMNIGRKGKTAADDIPAYNGGLFYSDELLDKLIIDDSILMDDLVHLSAYDFNTDVDVNILGHIFEHSLGEIEEITAQIEGTAAEKAKGRRKKDGVFYTPKYITQYIVENTIGKLCKEKRAELGIDEIEFDGTHKAASGKLSAKGKKLFIVLEDYKKWLVSLNIIDPACGSGAFLNQALNFLIEEHRIIDDIIAELTGEAMRLFDTDKSILENNLYGVDINEESVEIAKLSLWLRTAQKGRKLSNLNSNIKCGNSLIDDPEIAGDKAFDWNKEFPQIFTEKKKKAWHITTATHNSRYSQREFALPVNRNNAIWLDHEDEIIITKAIAEIVKEDNLNVIEYNICGDHLHMLLVCEEDKMPGIVGKIKSISSRTRNIAKGFTTSEKDSESGGRKSESDTGNGRKSEKDSESGGRSESDTENGGKSEKDRESGGKSESDTENGRKSEKDRESGGKSESDMTTGHAPLSDTDADADTDTDTDTTASALPDTTTALSDTDTTYSVIPTTERKRGETQTQLWTQKFGKSEIKDEEYLNNVIAYIRNNRLKHKLPKSKEIEKLKKEFLCTVKQAYRTEYNGGFDCVIGNPPYGAKIPKIDYDFYSKKYETAHYKLDTFSLFIEKSIIIIKENGILGLIVPYTWLTIQQHSKLRKYILNYNLQQIIDLPTKIFADADLDTVISIIRKDKLGKEIKIGRIISNEIKLTNTLSYKNIKSSSDLLINVNLTNIDYKILDKTKKHDKLNDFFDVSQGLIPYDKYRGHTTEQIKNRVFHSNVKEDETYRKELKGSDISRYKFNWNGELWISYGDWLAAPRNKKYFNSPRILIMEVTRGDKYVLKSCFIKDEFYNTPTLINIISKNNNVEILKYLLSTMNSSLFSWYHKKVNPKANAITSIPKILVNDIRNLPFRNIDIEVQQLFIEKADKMLELNKQLQEKKAKFLNRVKDNFELEKISKKLDAFYNFEFKTLVVELKKQKVKLSLMQQDEWEEYFMAYKTEINQIQAEIESTDKEIDRMVYDLYELTDEEISIIENS